MQFYILAPIYPARFIFGVELKKFRVWVFRCLFFLSFISLDYIDLSVFFFKCSAWNPLLLKSINIIIINISSVGIGIWTRTGSDPNRCLSQNLNYGSTQHYFYIWKKIFVLPLQFYMPNSWAFSSQSSLAQLGSSVW